MNRLPEKWAVPGCNDKTRMFPVVNYLNKIVGRHAYSGDSYTGFYGYDGGSSHKHDKGTFFTNEKEYISVDCVYLSLEEFLELSQEIKEPIEINHFKFC